MDLADPGTCYGHFLIVIFILLQKNAFGPINFQLSCMGSKVPFWQFFIFFQNGTLEPMHEN